MLSVGWVEMERKKVAMNDASISSGIPEGGHHSLILKRRRKSFPVAMLSLVCDVDFEVTLGHRS